MNRIQNHMHKWSFLIHVLITLVRGRYITLHNYELIRYHVYFISKTSLCNLCLVVFIRRVSIQGVKPLLFACSGSDGLVLSCWCLL